MKSVQISIKNIKIYDIYKRNFETEQENGSNTLITIFLINDISFIKGTYFLFITF